jgi:hypothetical protein
MGGVLNGYVWLSLGATTGGLVSMVMRVRMCLIKGLKSPGYLSSSSP